MMDFRRQYDGYLEIFEAALKQFCAEMDYEPPVLTESMRYSLLSGGKRVRPVLFFGALDLFGGDPRGEEALAVALECIHTYSLIHDDLPALDNDDFRRGNPSNHKVYGEANAILAGDALLSAAASVLLGESGRDERHLRAARLLMDAAGPRGMLSGQSADLLYAGKTAGERELFFLYERKTGKLITAPLTMAAVLTDGDVSAMERFGSGLGMLFQLTDDILDEKGEPSRMGKTLHKDREEDKLTCVKVYGLRNAESLADRVASDCLAALQGFGERAGFFRDFVMCVRERDN